MRSAVLPIFHVDGHNRATLGDLRWGSRVEGVKVVQSINANGWSHHNHFFPSFFGISLSLSLPPSLSLPFSIFMSQYSSRSISSVFLSSSSSVCVCVCVVFTVEQETGWKNIQINKTEEMLQWIFGGPMLWRKNSFTFRCHIYFVLTSPFHLLCVCALLLAHVFNVLLSGLYKSLFSDHFRFLFFSFCWCHLQYAKGIHLLELRCIFLSPIVLYSFHLFVE